MSERKIEVKRKIVKLNKITDNNLISLNTIRPRYEISRLLSNTNSTKKSSFNMNKLTEGLAALGGYLTEVCLSDIIPILKKSYKQRSQEELILVHRYLLKTDLMRKILKDKLEDSNSNRVFYFCSLYMNYQFLEKDSFLFRKGDHGDRFFVILEGSINILDYQQIEKFLNGQDYFLHLIKLKSDGHSDLVSKIISANISIYPFNLDDLKMHNIENIFLRHKIRSLIRQSFDKKQLKLQILKLVESLKMEKFLYDLSFIEDNYYNINFLSPNKENTFIEDEDRKRFLEINNSGLNLNFYNYIDFKEEKMVLSFEYKVYLKLSKGEHFGDFALDNNDGLRKASVNTDEETHLGALPQDVYRNYIFNDKMRFINKVVQFLQPNFFFKDLKFESFKEKYLNFFILQEYPKNKIIFNQNTILDYIYFVKEGEIELILKASLIELNDLIMKIGKRVNNTSHDLKHFEIVYKEFTAEINKKLQLRIRIFGNFTCLGIEEYYYKFNTRLYSAKANIDNCKLYKIEVDKLNIIGQEEKTLNEQIKHFSKKYLSSLVSRLVELRSTLLEEIHKKENERFKEVMEATIHNKNEEILSKAISNGPQVSNTFYLKQYQDLVLENGQNLTLNFQTINNNKSLFLTTEKFKTIPELNVKSSRIMLANSIINDSKKKKLDTNFNKNKENKFNLSREEEKEKFLWEDHVKKKLMNFTKRSNSMLDLNDLCNKTSNSSTVFSKKQCLPWSYINQTLLSARDQYVENHQSVNNLSSEMNSHRFNVNLNLVVKNTKNNNITNNQEIKKPKNLKRPDILNSIIGTKNMYFKKIINNDIKENNSDLFISTKLNNDLIRNSYFKVNEEKSEEVINLAKLPSLLNKNTINYVYNNIKENFKKKKKFKTASVNYRPNIKKLLIDKS